MINFAKFEIIGRIGEIDARPKVTLLSVCANYRRKGDDDEWQEDSQSIRPASFRLSPVLGRSSAENICEADLSIEQCADRQQRALRHAVAVARILYMLDHRFLPNAEDLANLPVGFPARDQRYTFSLPLSQARAFAWSLGLLGQSARSFECEAADQLDERELSLIEHVV